MTFIYELDAYSREIHRMCKYELPTLRLSKVIVWQIYREAVMLCVITSSHLTKTAVTPVDRSAVVEDPMLNANLMAPSFIIEVMGDQVYNAGIGIFDVFGSCDLDLNSMTFIYELDPYCRQIQQMYKYQLCTSTLWKVIVWQTDRPTNIETDRRTDRQTESTEIINHTASRVVNSVNKTIPGEACFGHQSKQTGNGVKQPAINKTRTMLITMDSDEKCVPDCRRANRKPKTHDASQRAPAERSRVTAW